jgi:pimeloyl-ACP methyl ester carboxylesterase
MEVGESRIHILRWEPPAGTQVKGRVFLVHGFAASVYCWRFLGPALAAEGYRVLAADYPPFGYSSTTAAGLAGPASTPEGRASLLWRLLAAEDAAAGPDTAAGGWTIVGHSLGGRISAWMALQRPEAVKRLILIAPAVFGPIGSPGLASSGLFRSWLEANLGKALGDEATIRSSLTRAYGRRPDQAELEGYWAPFLRSEALPALIAWARAASERREPALASIAAPTLVLWGSADRIVRPQGPRLARTIAGARFVGIKGGSHCLMETQFGETWAAISAFLAD